MVEYHKSSAALSLTAQLIVRVKLVRAITAVRSLGEDEHPHPASSAKTKKKAANPKINGFLN